MITSLVPETTAYDLKNIDEPIRLHKSIIGLMDRLRMYIPIQVKKRSFKFLFINPVDILYTNGLTKSARRSSTIRITENAVLEYVNRCKKR
jgi:hypothetical protein